MTRSSVRSERSSPRRPADFFASLHEATKLYAMRSFAGPALLFKRTENVTQRHRPEGLRLEQSRSGRSGGS